MTDSPNSLLLIFTRNPELGKCKTRLAATIGNESALKVYEFLLQHTAAVTRGVSATKRVYYSEEIWEDDLWSDPVFEKHLQEGIDLGARMHQAFKNGFEEGFEKIIIIGSDLYEIDTEALENAFQALDDHDFVIGPAEDGGYYLLGMKTLEPQLFNNKVWGTGTVLKDTLSDLQGSNLYRLQSRNDVDIYEDIADIEAFKPFFTHLKK